MKKKEWIILFLLICGIGRIFAAACGDVDSSGGINVVDALMCAQYYVGLNPQPFDASVAEVSGDGTINIVDALQIAQYYVGLITSFSGCKPITQTETYELQAETEATWNDAIVDDSHAGYTGSGFVDTTNTSGAWIQWDIDLASATNANCEFRYACTSNRSMNLSVNGSSFGSLAFPASGSWDSWSTETVAVSLKAGSNTIRLTAATSDGAPNMDKMDITLDSSITIVTPPPTPIATPTPTTQSGGLFVETYVPSVNKDLWDEYIAELDYVVETGGNGGTRTIRNPILVKQGTTYDGKGEKLTSKGLGDGSQDETQRPYFLLEPGATLKNVTILSPGVEGVHCMGDNTIENVHWDDIGEDALSVRSYFPGGDINISNGTAYDGDDKCFQFNSPVTVRITNFKTSDIGKFVRQNGGETFAMEVYLDSCTVNNFSDAIVRSDSSRCFVYYRNLKSNISESKWWKLKTTPKQY